MPVTVRRQLLALLLSTGFVGAAWCEQDILLLNGSGKFLQFELHTSKVKALWELSSVSGMAEIIPRGPMDGLPLEGLAFDPIREVIYLLSPKEARMDEWGRKGYRVAALRFPGMELLATWEVPTRPETMPSIALLPEGKRLLVHYVESEPWLDSPPEDFVFVTVELRTPSLLELNSYRAKEPREPQQRTTGHSLPTFGPDAHAVRDDLLIDRYRIIRLQNGRLKSELLAPLSALTEEEREALSNLSTNDEHGDFVTSGVVSRDGGRVLVQVSAHSDRPSPETALFVLDPVTRDATTPFRVPSVRAWLVGTRVVTIELEDGSTTGRLVVYDSKAGRKVRAIENPLLAGADSRFVDLACYVGDNVVLLGPNSRPLLLELETGEAKGVQAEFKGDSSTRCMVMQGGAP